MKYTLIVEDEYSGSKTTREFTSDFLPDVLSETELFLRGAGFFFDGTLDIIVEPEYEDSFELSPTWAGFYPIEPHHDGFSHDASYFNDTRNK